MHRLKSDEIFHFYAGDPAEILLLDSNESNSSKAIIGNNLLANQTPQLVIPRGTWQGMRTLGEWTLLGCTVSPGFEYADYESGRRRELVGRYPEFRELIEALTEPLS